MNKQLRIVAGVAALTLSLSGCGELATDRPVRDALTNIVGLAVGSGQPEQIGNDPRQNLTRAMIDQGGVPVILVVVSDRDAAATLVRTAENRGKVTWVSPDGIGVVLRDGFLIATRGLGDDLMGAEVNGSQSALRRGGTSTRIHDYLTGTDAIARRSFQCTFAAAGTENIVIIQRSYAVTRFDETCADNTTRFVNSYWIGAGGIIWKSRQWVSAIVGSLEIMQL